MGELFQPLHLLILSVSALFFIIPTVFYILTLQKALNKCHPAGRMLDPGMCWLLLVPFVNLVWHFFVVLGVANSFGNEFARRGIPVIGSKPGQEIGIAMCVCGVCTIIPILGALAGIAFLVLWIMYWAKIANYSRQLDLMILTQNRAQ